MEILIAIAGIVIGVVATLVITALDKDLVRLKKNQVVVKRDTLVVLTRSHERLQEILQVSGETDE